MLPGFKVLGRVPPDRSDITLIFAVLAALLVASFYTGQLFKLLSQNSKVFLEVAVLIFSIILVVTSFKITCTLASDIYIAKDYSSTFDKVILEIKSAAKDKKHGIIVVDKLPDSGLIGSADLKGYPDNEKNNAIARYYGIDALIVK